MDPKTIEDLARRLAASVPESLREFREDLDDNFHAVLRSGIARLDLVTREEFDIQAAMLERARSNLEKLRERMEQLEARLGEPDPGTDPAD